MSRSSSAVVDSKVVEMSLENSNFEQNATKSLSTLQKLKEALNFTHHKDGIDRFSGSLKKVDFNPLNAGINTAREGISALDAVSFGFFSKIGSQIEQTTMKYAQMFSGMKQATDGFAEYELKMGSVQTILMGAKTKEGLPVTLDMVNQKLDELNTYADKTIYSFSDMTASIGKFTNAGVDLDTAVAAIQGISNEAALSGANAQQASHAMYNFAQALSSGYVKLIDWKSIENANMATVDFKQTLIDTALELGTIKKEGDKFVSTTTDMNGKVSEAFTSTLGFNDSLSSQWMTTDVLTAALAKYSDETSDVGKKAFQAATEVKTFHQLLDTLQEAAGSGWAQTWELIIGDFAESKSLFTMLSDTFGGIIDAQAKTRNALLEQGLGGAGNSIAVTEEYFKSLGMGAIQSNTLRKSLMELGKANGVVFRNNDARGFFESLSSGWLTVDMLRSKMEELNGVGTEGPDEMTKSLDEMKEAALKVIQGGDSGYSGDMAERFKQLTEDGFEPEKIQAYVNEIHKLAGGTWNVTDAIMEEAAANVGLNETMTKSSGLFDDILDKVQPESSKKTGRELLFDALKTSLWSFTKIASTVKTAWREVFPPATAETVYKITEGINGASKALRHFAIQNAERIRIVFKAIFNILDLVLRTGKAVIKEVFEGLKKAFSGGDGQAGAFIEKIAKLINKFHDWVVENEIIEKEVGKIGDAIGAVITTIVNWIDAIGKIPQVQNVLESFGETFSWIGSNIGPIFEKAGGKLSLFSGRIARAFQNSDSPVEFFKRIKAAFDGLWRDIYSSETFGKIKEAFGVLGENIQSFFDDLGNNEDGTRNTFGKILDAVSNFKTKFMQILSGVDENGEKIDIIEGVKDAFTGLWDDISASGVIDKIKDGLKAVWDAIDTFFTSLGTNEDGSLNLFGQIYETIKTGFTWIHDKAVAAKTAISDFFAQYKVGEFFSKMLGNLSTGFGNFFTSLPGFFSGAKDKFGEFINKVKGFGGFKEIFNPDKFGDIWNAFKDTVGKYFKDAKIFEPIKTAFGNIKNAVVEHFGELIEKIKAKFNSLIDSFSGLGDILSNIKESLKNSFGDLVDGGPLEAIMKLFTGDKVEAAEKKTHKFGKSLKKSGRDIGTFFKDVKDGFKNSTFGQVVTKIVSFIGRLGSALLDISPDTIFSIVKAFVAFKIIKGVWNEIKGSVGELVSGISALWKSMAVKNKAKANFINKAALLELAAAIAIVGYVIYQLAQIEDMEKAWNAFGILAAMLGVMFVVSLLMSKLVNTSDLSKIGFGLILFGVACAAVGYAIKEVASIENIEKAWNAFGVLAAILAVAAVILIIGSKLGAGAASFGLAMVEMAGAFILAAIALKVFSSVDFEACVQNLVDAVKAWNKGISEIESDGIDLVKSAELLAQLKGIAWVLKDAAIDGFIIAVGDFVAGLIGQGTTMENFGEGVQGLVDAIIAWNDGMATLPPDATGILKSAVFLAELYAIAEVLKSSAISGFILALGTFVTDLLGQDPPMEQFKKGVSDLVDSIIIWNEGMDRLPLNGWNVLKSAVFLTELAGIAAVLGAAEIVGFLNAVMTFVSNMIGQEPPMAQFKKGIKDLLESIKIWNEGVEELPVNAMAIMKSFALLAVLANITAVLAAAEITAFLGAVMDFVYKQMGGKQTVMEKFKQDVGILAQVITDWQTTTESVNAVEANELTDAVDNIVKVLDHISTSGFWTRVEEFITGGGDFVEDFKNDATSLGTAVTSFIGAFDVTPEEAEKATKIVDALARLGGNMAMFVTDTSALANGQTNLQNFGDALGDGDNGLGRKLSNFVEQCPDAGTFTTITASFRSLINATQILTEMDLDTGDFFDASKIETMRTNVSMLTGVVYAASSAGALSLGVPLFTAAIGSLAGVTISGGEISNSDIVTKVVNNVKRLVDLIGGTLKTLDTSGVDKFTSSLDKINTAKISGAAAKLSEANKAATSSGSDAGKEVSDSLAKGISSDKISGALSSAVQSAVSGIKGMQSEFFSAGRQFMIGLANGITQNKSSVADKVKGAVDDGVSRIKGMQSEFFGAGRNFVIGLANGINQNRSSAIDAAAKVAAEALKRAKQELDIKSPSRETEKVGRFFDLGLAKGINEYGSNVLTEVDSVASLMMDGLSKAVAISSDLLTNDDNRPVITPVLDLSEIQSGAGAIGGILSSSPASILGNFSAISENADAMRQRANSDDVLSALESLGSSLNSNGGNTYIVNGVTYDDGSNVSEAVRSLIHAAKVERRA